MRYTGVIRTAGKKEVKTNAMRILDKAKIAYKTYEYETDGVHIDGVTVANTLGQNPNEVFKTLVTHAKSGAYCVFVIPVAQELDLKKAAKAAGEKSVEMIAVKEINAVTGYIRGGCSPIGMKKQYLTVIDSSAESLEKIIVSGGKIGAQIELLPCDLLKAARAKYADITHKAQE